MSKKPRNVLLFATAALFLGAPGLLRAQSCALCYQSAASSGPEFIQALRSGILILLFPPLAIGVAFMIAAYRKRNTFQRASEASLTGLSPDDCGEPFLSADRSIAKTCTPVTASRHEILSDTLA